jgi:hypothetical protein
MGQVYTIQAWGERHSGEGEIPDRCTVRGNVRSCQVLKEVYATQVILEGGVNGGVEGGLEVGGTGRRSVEG